jgi:hypothetical protein
VKLESGLAALGAYGFLRRGERLPNTSYFAFSRYRWRNAGRQARPGRLCGGQRRGLFECQSGAFACAEAMGVAPELARARCGSASGGNTRKKSNQFINALQAYGRNACRG